MDKRKERWWEAGEDVEINLGENVRFKYIKRTKSCTDAPVQLQVSSDYVSA